VANKRKIIAVLRLINTPKVGTKTFYKLVDDFGSPEEALKAVENSSRYCLWPEKSALDEYERAAQAGVKIVIYDDDEYPKILTNTDYKPPLLYVKGNMDALAFEKAVAIVGGRAASVNGRKTAAKIAYDLTSNGVCIVSGMARGIDTSAHKGAMYALGQKGKTIAVLGTGIDIVYPPENKDVYDAIVQNGCIITEMPFGTQASSGNFPRRNRIVAALSEAIVVVEANINSGSLITANFGVELGKIIFAVPGTPGESRSSGSNMLIKNGAVLAETADDILPFLKEDVGAKKIEKQQAKQKVLVFENNDVNYSEQENIPKGLVDFISLDGTDIDELIRITGKDAATVAMEILELELAGVVERRLGNKVAVVNRANRC